MLGQLEGTWVLPWGMSVERRWGVGAWGGRGAKVLRRRLEEVCVMAEFLVEYQATLEFLLDGVALPGSAHVLPIRVILREGKRVQELSVREG